MADLRSISATKGGFSLAYAHGGIASYRPGERFGQRRLSDFEIVWMIQGEATYRADGREYFAPPGSIILAKPGSQESYVWDPSEPTRHAYVHFNLSSVPSDWPEPARWPVLTLMKPRDVVRPLLRRVIDQWASHQMRTSDVVPPRRVQRMIEVVLDTLLLEPQAMSGTSAPTERELPAAVQRALDLVVRVTQTEGYRPVALEDLAEAAMVTPKHLCRLFDEAVGRSPMFVVRVMRLERAMTLLARSNLNMAEISRRCGFATQFHFSRVFKSIYGRSPTLVRKALFAGQPAPPPPLRLHLWGGVEW